MESLICFRGPIPSRVMRYPYDIRPAIYANIAQSRTNIVHIHNPYTFLS